MSAELVDHEAFAAAIRRWPPQDRRWWRELLDVAPQEALLVAALAARMGARVVELEPDVPMPLNPPAIDQTVRPGSLRRAPVEARMLLARMHDGGEETDRAA